MMGATWALALWWSLGVADASVGQVRACLRAQDVACAQEAVASGGLATSSSPDELAWAAEVSFSVGDYPEAYDRIQRAVEAGFQDRSDRLALYQRAMFATAGWVEVARGRFRIRYRPGVDAVLIEGAADALEATDRFVTPLLGELPPGETITEIFPDGRSFIAASSLTKDDVESTGVVALSKWTRLLLTSPRALGRGYEWQSTLSHEYIHLVVAHNTFDRAPVWLQEAIAKYLDGRWEGGGADAFRVSVRSQGYLAAALRDDAFVPFEEITALGSLAKIKVLREDGSIDQAASSERAALAYAQLSTLMAYCFREGGEDVLLRALPAIQADPQGRDNAREHLTKAVGMASFAEVEQGWRDYLRGLNLTERSVDEMPTVLDGGDDADLDPVLSRRRDLANFMRLGDLLYERGRPRAALIEYDKAQDEEDPNSPLLANRRARALVAQDEDRDARRVLEESLKDYPAFPMTHRSLGDLAKARGDVQEAVRYYETSVSYDPYEIDTQQALADLYKQLGQGAKAGEKLALVQILRLGGEDELPDPIHENAGTYELPRSPEAAVSSKGGADLQGQPAPDFEVEAIDGTPIKLSSLAGQVVMLDFWATWCGPCKAIMPKLSALQEAHRDEGLTVLSISDELSSKVRQFLMRQEKKGTTYAQTIALESGAVRRAYGVKAIPMLAVIDRAGMVRLVHVGAGDMAEVETLVRELLDEKPEADGR